MKILKLLFLLLISISVVSCGQNKKKDKKKKKDKSESSLSNSESQEIYLNEVAAFYELQTDKLTLENGDEMIVEMAISTANNERKITVWYKYIIDGSISMVGASGTFTRKQNTLYITYWTPFRAGNCPAAIKSLPKIETITISKHASHEIYFVNDDIPFYDLNYYDSTQGTFGNGRSITSEACQKLTDRGYFD